MNKSTDPSKAEQPNIPHIEKFVAFENGTMGEREMTAFFQELIDSGHVWRLQGTYGRIAEHLIKKGVCKRKL